VTSAFSLETDIT